MTLEDILYELYMQAAHEETSSPPLIAEATEEIRTLIDEKLHQPIHEVAERASERAPSKNLSADYLNGVWNALYWVLSKIDAFLEEETSD